MSNRLRLVRGDTPQVTVRITDSGTGAPVDLVGATCRMKFKRQASLDAPTIVIGTPLPGIEDDNGAVTYPDLYTTPGRGGRVLFAFPEPITAPPGQFEFEVEVTFPGGAVMTVYDRGYATLREQF